MIRLTDFAAEFVCRVASVKCPGFRNRKGGRNRLEVAHFPYQHHIGVLSERYSQGAGKAFGVLMHFPLVNHAFAVLVHELDRVFDREYMAFPFIIYFVNHRGKGRALSASGWAGDEDQAVGFFR